MPRFGFWLDCACLQYNFSAGNASFRLLAWVYAGICARIREYGWECASMRQYVGYTRVYARICASTREYARVYASVREYVWVYERKCVGMREYAWACASTCMRDYAGVCASMHGYTRVHARVCVGMREHAAVCVGIREYMRGVCAPAHFQTRCVNHVVCQARLLGGNSKYYDFLSALNMRKRLCGLLKYPAVTWGKAILL